MTETRTSEFDYNDEEGLSGLSCYGDEDDKGGVLKDGLSCYGDQNDKVGILGDGFSGLPSTVEEDRLSGLSCYGTVEDDKGGILEHGSSGLPSCGVKDVKDRNLEDWLSGLPPYGKGGILEDGFSVLSCYGVEYDGPSGLSCYGVEDVKGITLEDWFSGVPSYGYKDVKGGILEDGFGEKVKKKKEGRMYELRDPLDVLGSNIMLLILSCLDARSVALCLIVSSGWHAVASSDMIWSSKCEELWQGKTHLPRIAKVNNLSKLAVNSLSAMDGKRKRIRREDLCDHGWEFHFTEAAPEYWRMLDPFWNGRGQPLMRRYFHPDGSHTADPDDKVWGGHECCYTVVTGLLADGNIRAHYVRINRLPPMYVTRKEDWSWELSNYLCTYRSLPDADKEDGTGPLLALH